MNQRDALYGHEPTPYPSGTILFRMLNTPSFFIDDETLDWFKLVQGDIHVFELCASHKNVILAPNIRKLGETLPDLLSSAQSEYGKGRPGSRKL